jgi:hypothetical protein
VQLDEDVTGELQVVVVGQCIVNRSGVGVQA